MHTVKAYVMIKTNANKAEEFQQFLFNKHFIKELDAILGYYDFVAVIVAENKNELGRIIIDEIRSFEGVLETVTHLTIR